MNRVTWVRSLVCGLPIAVLCSTTALAAEACGSAGKIVGKVDNKPVSYPSRVFRDGSIAVRAPLAVNPDGGSGSYTVGNHGFTYVQNGLDAWRAGRRVACDAACMTEFAKAEAAGFASAGEEFCVFAMVVEPLSPNQALSACTKGTIAGNGKGRIKFGTERQTVAGTTIQTYASTTSLRHMSGGKAAYLDSESLPVLVTNDSSLLRKIVWVGGQDLHGTFGLIGDVGPAFGEGSIALHQLLRDGSVTTQSLGPIPVGMRCQQPELALKAPFISRPDSKNDACRPGRTPTSVSDIRAYKGIDEYLDFVVLGEADFPRGSNGVLEEVTPASIELVARKAGYSDEKIQEMRQCLHR
ncbi:hypothetical protein AWB80_06217 [Caballeronia pedi]|uniref:Lipoprotein n=1 Tax=Caballeronia pedi TaxID=1777141 RepID=A0A158D595_9BURK|nr:hypothetical protein [Caballeronia pedi]SAK88977.1 hypothetical protein AWB80_06217 [Caballeronia pedi]